MPRTSSDHVNCPSCNGKGYDSPDTCSYCHGNGEEKCDMCGGDGIYGNTSCKYCYGRGYNPCGNCHKIGSVQGDACDTCNGDGTITAYEYSEYRTKRAEARAEADRRLPVRYRRADLRHGGISSRRSRRLGRIVAL